MGKCTIELPTDLNKMLGTLAENTDAMCIEAAKEVLPIMEKALKEECAKHNTSKHDKTRGEMVASIQATKPKKNKYGIYSFVRPTGTDSKGVRNMEKLAYLEYGKEGQAATPVCTPVKNRIGAEVSKKIQKSFERQAGL